MWLSCLQGLFGHRQVWEEFVSRQEQGNDHDRHAVVVHREGEDVLGHLPHEVSSVAYFFLEHDGCITGNRDNSLEVTRNCLSLIRSQLQCLVQVMNDWMKN